MLLKTLQRVFRKMLNQIGFSSIPMSFFIERFSALMYSHSDSLDTLLYVRFAIQNLEFSEWKLGDHG